MTVYTGPVMLSYLLYHDGVKHQLLASDLPQCVAVSAAIAQARLTTAYAPRLSAESPSTG